MGSAYYDSMNRAWAGTAENKALAGLVDDLSEVADLSLANGRSIVTLIANVKQASNVLAVVFQVMSALGVQVEMLSQGASKVNLSLVVQDADAEATVELIHSLFIRDGAAEAVPASR